MASPPSGSQGSGASDGRRRIFIGDVQGCRQELEDLLDRVAFDPVADRLHPVGDLVNRGPDSLGSLRLLRELEAQPVLGNHDLHLLGVHAGRRSTRKQDTLDELLASPECDVLCAWLADQPFLRAWDDLWMVHAGLHPDWEDPREHLGRLDPLAPDAAGAFAVRVRRCDASGESPEPDDGDPRAPRDRWQPWFDFYDPARHGGRSVVFGHWARMGLVRRPGLVGLDTGCVWGGRLSAWVAEEDRVVDVPARRAYARF